MKDLKDPTNLVKNLKKKNLNLKIPSLALKKNAKELQTRIKKLKQSPKNHARIKETIQSLIIEQSLLAESHALVVKTERQRLKKNQTSLALRIEREKTLRMVEMLKSIKKLMNLKFITKKNHKKEFY